MIHSPDLNLTPAELDAVIHINKSNTKHAYEHWAQKYHGTRATFCERLTLARRKLRAWTDATDPGNPEEEKKTTGNPGIMMPIAIVEVQKSLNFFKIAMIHFIGFAFGAATVYTFFVK